MNSSFNISYSTRRIIVEEFWRGSVTAERIIAGELGWSALFEMDDSRFEKDDFFRRYRVYFQLDIVAETEELHYKWYGPALPPKLCCDYQ